MKHTIAYSLLFSLLIACGTDGSATEESRLTCSSAAYCSSWWIVGTQVDSLPEPTGGVIESGTYILNDALSVEAAWDGDLRELLVIDGNSFRSTEDSSVGTFTTNEGTITFSREDGCSYLGDSFDSEPSEISYEYLVQGNSIVLFEEGRRSVNGVTIRVGLVFTRHTEDLCDVSGSATCSIGECFCAASIGSGLEESVCGS